MRVAIDVSAIPDDPAGAGVYVFELIKALGKLSPATDPETNLDTHLDLHLVARNDDGERWHSVAPTATIHSVVPISRPSRLAWEQMLAPRLAKQIEADVWHGPHYTIPLMMPLSKPSHQRKNPASVVTIHDLTFFDHPEWHERSKVAYFRPMIRAAAKRSQVLIGVSDWTTKRLIEIVGPKAAVVTITHGVDHARFSPSDRHQRSKDLSLLSALGISAPFIAFAGTIEPRKNITSLIRSFDAIAEDQLNLQLVIAGQPGWGSDEVKKALSNSRHRDRIILTGYVETEVIPALFRQATVVAYPSLEEGFGLPALEALACGAPLVTTTGSAMEDVVGEAAILVPPNDDASLTQALSHLIEHSKRRETLAKAGPPQAASFTWQRCADLHLDAYRLAMTRAKDHEGKPEE
ncbi:MAG: glycosyltransferase family 4 protein [Acidimicrobiales bacterium]